MITQIKPTCQEQVPQSPGSYLSRDCGITARFYEADPAWTSEGGKLKWYCRRHAPSIVAAKHATRNAAWDARWAAERAETEAKKHQQAEDARKLAAFDALLDAAEWAEVQFQTLADTLPDSPLRLYTDPDLLSGGVLHKLQAAIKKARKA